MREKTDIIVKILDLAPLFQQAIDIYKESHPNTDAVGMTTPFEIGFVELDNGDLYALDSDGCGPANPINDQVRMSFDLFLDIPKKADGTISLQVAPVMTANLNRIQIRSLPVKREVDLSEFIRTFGSRLETNFREWRDKLSPAKC